MEKILLEAEKRVELGSKANRGRKKGLIPAVVYGKGIKSECLWVNSLEFKRLLKKSGESVIINLSIDKKNERNVIVHEIQKEPVKGSYLHIDFYQVNMSEKIETEVELLFINESPAVKETSGVLVKNIDKVKVKCLPGDLPSHIDVDISVIKTFDDHIFAKDLKVSEKVELELDPEMVIALVAPPRSEEELSELEQKVEEDVTKVEGVIKPVRPGEEAPVEAGSEEKEPARNASHSDAGGDKKDKKKE